MKAKPPAIKCSCPPKDGYDFIPWIGHYFGDCIRTPVEMASFSSGIISLCFYIVALFPQLWLNFKRKSIEGLSTGLILLWAFGDCCNLVGSILTNQLPTQIDTATYFVAVDMIMIFQFLWYTNLRVTLFGLQPRHGSELTPLLAPHTGEDVIITPATSAILAETQTSTTTTTPHTTIVDIPPRINHNRVDERGKSILQLMIRQVSSGCGRGLVGVLVVMVVGIIMVLSQRHDTEGGNGVDTISTAINGTHHRNNSFSPFLPPPSHPSPPPPRCDARAPQTPTTLLLGSVAAWTSGTLYFVSRIPQVRENAKSQSVEGLSIALFFCTLMGNSMYGVSVLLRVPVIDWSFVQSELPFLIGSIGVLIFDTIIMYQYYLYKNNM